MKPRDPRMEIISGYHVLGGAQVEIYYAAGEQQYAQAAMDALTAALPGLVDYFQVRGQFPRVRAVLAPARGEFDRLVRGLLRVAIEVPSHPARIAQPQGTDLVLLSPAAYAAQSKYQYRPDDFRRLLAHELVHMVEELLSPDIESSPRWWGEGLAVYLSQQWRYEDEFRKAAVDGVRAGQIPGFAQIAAERKLDYDWGWTVVRWIESAYGRGMIVRIVRECADGGVLARLGEDPDALERRWRAWLGEQGM